MSLNQRLVTDLIFKAGNPAPLLSPSVNEIGDVEDVPTILRGPIPPGATVIVEHGLHENVIGPVEPSIVFPDRASTLQVTAANKLTVTIFNPDTVNAQEVALRCERKHTLEETPTRLVDMPWQGLGVGILNTGGPIGVVFRPGDPLGSRFNVYTTWAGAYAALQATAGLGIRYLEYDDTFATPTIPAGTWDISDVVQLPTPHLPGVIVEILQGATFVAPGKIISFTGTRLQMRYNGIGPVTPYDGANFVAIVMYGARTQFINTLPGVGTILKTNPAGGTAVAFAGNNSLGGFGNGVTCPSPLVEVTGLGGPNTGLLLEMGAGFINDNALIGPGLVTMNIGDDNANGGQTPGQTWNFPAFTGTFAWNVRHRTRHQVLTPAGVSTTPYNATFGEVIGVHTAAVACTVNAPRARPSRGERVTVIDLDGNAAVNPITFAPTGGDTVHQPVMNTANGNATWINNGLGGWWRMNS